MLLLNKINKAGVSSSGKDVKSVKTNKQTNKQTNKKTNKQTNKPTTNESTNELPCRSEHPVKIFDPQAKKCQISGCRRYTVYP